MNDNARCQSRLSHACTIARGLLCMVGKVQTGRLGTLISPRRGYERVLVLHSLFFSLVFCMNTPQLVWMAGWR